MTDPKHADALATIRELHALGATHVKVDAAGIEVRFDRVFVPVQPTTLPAIGVRQDGDEIVLSADDVQRMHEELEGLREQVRRAEAYGVI